MTESPSTPRAQRWLGAIAPVVCGALPPPPARVVELGCGPQGGFVPLLRADGYDALGIDPNAPEGPHYRRVEFESAELPESVDAVLACFSLHHVADPREVVERIAGVLTEVGTLVVVEWDWAAFDEATAAWCFERLDAEGEPGWLHRRHDAWLASGQPWSAYFPGWALEHGLHDVTALLELLDERFECQNLARGAYFFPELARTTEEDELAAIRAGVIRAPRVDYVGRPPRRG